MAVALLAATDPCGWVERGGSADAYAGIAVDVITSLQRGAGAAEVVQLLPADVNVEVAATFARATVGWWRSASSR